MPLVIFYPKVEKNDSESTGRQKTFMHNKTAGDMFSKWDVIKGWVTKLFCIFYYETATLGQIHNLLSPSHILKDFKHLLA